MHITNAKNLAQYHKFTRAELYQILKDALEKRPENYWSKPSHINPMFDYGCYFNKCRDWLGYIEGKNDETVPAEMIVVRILQGFGSYSKVQLPKKVKPEIKLVVSEKPTL